MTDTFIPADQGTVAPESPTDVDKTLPGTGEPDTKSPEYQLQMLQKRLNDKDQFIETLKQEKQSVMEKYASLEERAKSIGDIEEVLKGASQAASNQNNSLDEDALVGKVIENLKQVETQATMQQNYEKAINRLIEEFGQQHVEAKVQAAAQSKGLQVSDMVEMAKKSPEAFYALVGVQEKRPTTPPPTHGDTRTPLLDTGEKDAAYYARLMRENPREYWKPSTQREFRKLFQQE